MYQLIYSTELLVIRATNTNSQQLLNDDDYKVSEIISNGDISLLETGRSIM